jgi:hypothetical protein
VSDFIAEYKVGKAVYQITKEGFVDNINPNVPGLAVTYPWDEIYASLEYERQENPRTGVAEPVLKWMRVYQKGGTMIAEMAIPNDLRATMLQFYEVFKQTQEQATKGAN